jgi:NAD+ synthase (glutamine-hydrolysing)
VFDGCSAVFAPSGRLLARGAAFEEDIFAVDLEMEAVFRERLLDPRHRESTRQGRIERGACVRLRPVQEPTRPPLPAREVAAGPGDIEQVYAALVLGLRDYARKNGFAEVVLGLSGGIDSSLSATIAVDALGAGHVVGVAMPSRFSSSSSLEDARHLVRLQGIRLMEIPIDGPFRSYLDLLAEPLSGRPSDTTEENLQPRVRGTVLMALSNRFGWLVLANGNKSETSVGYVTLYGDSAGGFAPLRDVPKTLVYALAAWRNGRPDGPRIPEHSIARPPSAELRPGQLDVDSLPPYEVLDPILEAYVEEERGVDEIVAMGFDRETVLRVARMVDDAEYKRRQSPPGIKITDRAFGRDRRMPVTNAWARSRRAGEAGSR